MTIANPAYDFLKADYQNPNLNECKAEPKTKHRSRAVYWGLGTYLLTPTTAFAAGSDTFDRVYQLALKGLDYGFLFVTIFAGVSWMLGHRSAAIEKMLCAVVGYLIAVHATDLLAFIKSI